MTDDVKSTGTCHYTMLKEAFWYNPIFTTIAKKSPYTEPISRGYVCLCKNEINIHKCIYRSLSIKIYYLQRILRTREAGLVDLWESWYIPNSDKCTKIYNRDKTPQRLTLSHISGAFILLGVGCVMSLLGFLVEHIRFYFSK